MLEKIKTWYEITQYSDFGTDLMEKVEEVGSGATVLVAPLTACAF